LPFCAFGRSRTVTALTQLRRKHATRRAATENDNIEANPLAYARRSYDAPLRTTTRAASNPHRLGMGFGDRLKCSQGRATPLREGTREDRTRELQGKRAGKRAW
jgi:hypothetical protein